MCPRVLAFSMVFQWLVGNLAMIIGLMKGEEGKELRDSLSKVMKLRCTKIFTGSNTGPK